MSTAERAVAPTRPSNKKKTSGIGIGMFLGLLIGLVAAGIREQTDRRPRNAAELSDALHLPVVAEIPHSKQLQIAHEAAPDDSPSEAFRLLQANLRYLKVNREIRSVLITSPGSGDGKTLVSWNLARTMASGESSVLLIEADLRNPVLRDALGLPDGPGLSRLLAGEADLAGAIHSVPVFAGIGSLAIPPVHREEANQAPTLEANQAPTLDVLVSDELPPNPFDLFGSDRMAQLLSEAEARYDLVIVDSPPTLLVADAIPLLQRVSAVLVVARLGKTSWRDAQRLRDQLTALRAPALGIVANDGASEKAYRYPSQR